MTNKIFVSAVLLLLACCNCMAQSSYRGLTPGQSTKADAVRVLGQPVTEISKTFYEYKSDKKTEQIFVQYRDRRDSAPVERIEAVYSDALERADVLRSLNLPAKPTTSQTNSKGRLEEYFATARVVLTYVSAARRDGVSRIGYYSRDLFEGSVSKLPPDAEDESEVLGARVDNTALNGSTLTYYPQPSIDQCESDCASNGKCKAFTWIRPGVYNPRDAAMCYLLSEVTRRISAAGHTSAEKGRR